MIFGHLIPRKIFIFFAIRCQILRLKCTKFVLGLDSTPNRTGRVYTAHTDPYLDLREATCKGEQEKGRVMGGKRRKGEGREGNDSEEGRMGPSCAKS